MQSTQCRPPPNFIVYLEMYSMKLCAGCKSPAKCTAAGKCLKAGPVKKAYGGMAAKKKPVAKKAYGGMAKKAGTAKKK